MTAWLTAAAFAAVVAPHLLRLETAAPLGAAAVWLMQLFVRALISVYGALLIISGVPQVATYAHALHWCWHGALPFLATHLRFTGHDVANVAALLPTIALTVSLLSGAYGVWRATRTVRRMMSSLAVGPGPQESVVLREPQILMAVAGLRKPTIVVSAAALVALDDEELAAGLAHERGHIAHRHRFIMLAGEIFATIARFLPGTRHAQQELLFHLERDADRYALAREHCPASLASAICKAAESAFGRATPVLSLGGSGVVRRLTVLLDEPARTRSTTTLAAVSTASLVVLSACLLVGLPAQAHIGFDTTVSSLPGRLLCVD